MDDSSKIEISILDNYWKLWVNFNINLCNDKYHNTITPPKTTLNVYQSYGFLLQLFLCYYFIFRNSVVTNYIYYFHHWLQLVISKINHLVYKHQKIVKNAHHNFLKPEVMSSNRLLKKRLNWYILMVKPKFVLCCIR